MPRRKRIFKKGINQKLHKTYVLWTACTYFRCLKPLSISFLKITCKNKFEWWSQSWFWCVQHLQTAYTSVLTCCSLETRSSRPNWNVVIVSLHMWSRRLRLCKVASQQFSNYTLIVYRDFICWRIKISEGKRQIQIAF